MLLVAQISGSVPKILEGMKLPADYVSRNGQSLLMARQAAIVARVERAYAALGDVAAAEEQADQAAADSTAVAAVSAAPGGS